MQRVQTCIFFTVPSTLALTVCRLGNHFVLVFILEWLTLLPLKEPFPQMSHFLLIISPLNYLVAVKVPTILDLALTGTFTKKRLDYQPKTDRNIFQGGKSQ
jgi:hypothetical protein